LVGKLSHERVTHRVNGCAQAHTRFLAPVQDHDGPCVLAEREGAAVRPASTVYCVDCATLGSTLRPDPGAYCSISEVGSAPLEWGNEITSAISIGDDVRGDGYEIVRPIAMNRRIELSSEHRGNGGVIGSPRNDDRPPVDLYYPPIRDRFNEFRGHVAWLLVARVHGRRGHSFSSSRTVRPSGIEDNDTLIPRDAVRTRV
jgi:hypothetical protein